MFVMNNVNLNAVNASIRANHAVMLSVLEGGSLRLSCTSIGAPTPTIVWEMNGQPAQFSTTEVLTVPQAQLVGAPGGAIVPNVTLGNVTSETLIMTAQYPTDNGSYTCFGSNDEFETNDSAQIYVQVLGMSDYYYTVVFSIHPHISSILSVYHYPGVLSLKANSMWVGSGHIRVYYIAFRSGKRLHVQCKTSYMI